MRTVGQSPWDDIKILGQRLGHLISNSEPGGTAPPLSFPPPSVLCWCCDCCKPRSAYSWCNLIFRGYRKVKKFLIVSKQWWLIWYVGKTCVQLVGYGWDIDITTWGKIFGHWYRKNHGVPLSPYCVYASEIDLWQTRSRIGQGKVGLGLCRFRWAFGKLRQLFGLETWRVMRACAVRARRQFQNTKSAVVFNVK